MYTDNSEKNPQISDETMKEIAKFFMKTSIPRILEQMKKEGENNVKKTQSY